MDVSHKSKVLASSGIIGLSWWLSSKESTCDAGAIGDEYSVSGWGRYPGGKNGNPTHSSILAWKIPWTEEPVGYQSMESKELDMTEQLNHHHYQTYKTQV